MVLFVSFVAVEGFLVALREFADQGEKWQVHGDDD
jgi:hypothetical protein